MELKNRCLLASFKSKDQERRGTKFRCRPTRCPQFVHGIKCVGSQFWQFVPHMLTLQARARHSDRRRWQHKFTDRKKTNEKQKIIFRDKRKREKKLSVAKMTLEMIKCQWNLWPWLRCYEQRENSQTHTDARQTVLQNNRLWLSRGKKKREKSEEDWLHSVPVIKYQNHSLVQFHSYTCCICFCFF